MDLVISGDLWDTMVDKLYDLNTGSAEIDPRLDYSGRGMYGKTCVGFTTDNPTFVLMAFTVVLNELEYHDDLHTVDDEHFGWYDLRVAQDSMGRSVIVYFPNLVVDNKPKS